MDRTSLSCAWLGAPHKQIYDQGGSPHADLRPGFQDQSRTEQYIQNTTEQNIRGPFQEHSHKQNCDQGAYMCTHNKQNYDQGAGWLAGWLGGWLAC